jgi:hypothetical protein
MTSCVEKLNVLLDHWAFFEKNNYNPDLNYWENVIEQEYKDDNMDAAAAFAAEDAADYNIPKTFVIPAPASATCIPVDNSPRCVDKSNTVKNTSIPYNIYCPLDCTSQITKGKCVNIREHCFNKNRNTIRGDISRKYFGNDTSSVQATMFAGNNGGKKK